MQYCPIYRLVVLLITPLFIYSCADDSTSPDPCDGASEVVARFMIEELVDTFAIESDTALSINGVRFSALDRYDTYEWHVGYDTRVFSDSSFQLLFRLEQVKLGEQLPITFIGKRTPRTECFPNDDGVDTLTKYLTIISKYDSPVLGQFRGSNLDAPSDSFTVEIFWRTETGLVMTNINYGCLDTIFMESSQITKQLGATIMTFDGNSRYAAGCDAPDGVVFLSDDRNSIRVEYEYGLERRKNVFKGVRIE
jgi:hypothetical protein